MKINYTKIFVFVVISFVSNKIRAQQDPHYSQFMFNKLTYNPGFAGATDGKICVSLLNRAQWVGFGGKTVDGLAQGDAPSNLIGSINSALSSSSEKFLSRIGVGLTFSKDQLGFETTVMPKLGLSYRHPFGDQNVLALGVGVGLMQKSLDGSKLKPQQSGDPKIPNVLVNGSATDIDLGLYYTKASLLGIFTEFYAGLSVTHLNQSKITYDWSGSTVVNNKMHYYFITGAEYAINNTLSLQPNIIVKKDPAKIQTDLNCYLIWNQNIRGGLTWRPTDAVVVLGGYQFPSIGQDGKFGALYIGYSYDLTTSKIITYSSGSHEIIVRYCFGLKVPKKTRPIRAVVTPRFM
ncbi:MAG: type IX secretion system membrane protein PorP/SprF [Bacteroidia bacterium]|nr:type IX secretion system membrane protein PorP/SprF [Bacteroidia bacterium]